MTTEGAIDCDLLVIGASSDAGGAFGMSAARTAGWH